MARAKKDKNVLVKAKDAVVDVAEKGGEAVRGVFTDDHKEKEKRTRSGRTRKSNK